MLAFKDVLSQAADSQIKDIHTATDTDLTHFLMNNWNKIAPEYSDSTLPLRVYQKSGLLILACIPGNSMHIQYQTPELLNIINNFFKKSVISKIIVRNKLQY